MIDCNSLNDFNPRLKAGRSAAMNKLEHTRLLLDCANPFWLLLIYSFWKTSVNGHPPPPDRILRNATQETAQ